MRIRSSYLASEGSDWPRPFDEPRMRINGAAPLFPKCQTAEMGDLRISPFPTKVRNNSAVLRGSGFEECCKRNGFPQSLTNSLQELMIIGRLLEIGDCSCVQRAAFIASRISGAEHDDWRRY